MLHRLLLALAALVAALTFAQAAPAWHGSGYWFFNGYFYGGDYTYHPNGSNPDALHLNRISWAPCSHQILHILLHWNGLWTGISAWPQSCDSYFYTVPSSTGGRGPVRYGGCENPPGLSVLWMNCRWGIGG